MSTAKRILALLLIVALCFSLVGCKKKKKVVIIKKPSPSVSDTVEDVTSDDLPSSENIDTGDNSYTDNNFGDFMDDYISDRELPETEVEVEQTKAEYDVKAVSFKITNAYQIVYPKGDEQLRQAANKLQNYLSKNKIDVLVVDDSTKAQSKEILLGNTNRNKSKLADNKYAVSILGEKLFFESGNFNGVVKAVSWFIAQPFKNDKVNTLTGSYDFASQIKRPDGTYTYVWGDEFDGNALDTAKWDFSSAISAESSFKLSRASDVVSVSDGLLKLTAHRTFDPDNNQIQAVAPYTVETKKHVNFQYGYLEMRARIPFNQGAWPSLWLSGACGTNSGAVVSKLFDNGDIYPANFSAEFDIIEYTTLQPNLHKWFYNNEQVDELIKDSTLISDYHSSLGAVQSLPKSDLYMNPSQSYVYQKIAFDWTPEELTIYVNDQELLSYNWKESVQLDELNDMTDFLNPVFIRLNNHLIMKNIPADFSTLPVEYYIDYVRLYQKSGTGGLWLAE